MIDILDKDLPQKLHLIPNLTLEMCTRGVAVTGGKRCRLTSRESGFTLFRRRHNNMAVVFRLKGDTHTKTSINTKTMTAKLVDGAAKHHPASNPAY